MLTQESSDTEILYGITKQELEGAIGDAMLKAGYEKRIEILKGRLDVVLETEGVTSPLTRKVGKAIEFWKRLKEGDKE